jgi:predicted metal-dependent HD superfamily phosphohydrolase
MVERSGSSVNEKANGIPTSLISRLMARYAEPHRRYHTWSHVATVFDASERISDDRSREIALAILFHDAVYDPKSHDNEEKSAELLLSEGRLVDEDEVVLKKARAMVLATKHFEREPESEQACIMVDADLSILGADDVTFDAYEDAIRQEYAFATDAQFATGRALVCQIFLDQPHIFHTPAARELWEKKAKDNLARSLARWKKGART